MFEKHTNGRCSTDMRFIQVVSKIVVSKIGCFEDNQYTFDMHPAFNKIGIPNIQYKAT